MTKPTNNCAPNEDSDQPGHPPSLIRVFAARMKKPWTFTYPLSTQRRLWSDCADAQADLSLHWAHTHFVVAHIPRDVARIYFSGPDLMSALLSSLLSLVVAFHGSHGINFICHYMLWVFTCMLQCDEESPSAKRWHWHLSVCSFAKFTVL